MVFDARKEFQDNLGEKWKEITGFAVELVELRQDRCIWSIVQSGKSADIYTEDLKDTMFSFKS